MAMSRGKAFAVQFLAVTTFLLFLPGVSRSDTYVRNDCDAGSVLRSLASEHSPDHAFKFDDDGKAEKSGHRTGKIEYVGLQAGSNKAGDQDASGHSSDHAFKFDDDDKAEKSDHRTGKIEDVGFQAGSKNASDPDGGDGDGRDVGVTNRVGSPATGSLTAIPDASGGVTSVPEPEVVSLFLIGGLFLIARRVIPFLGRLGHWLSGPTGGGEVHR